MPRVVIFEDARVPYHSGSPLHRTKKPGRGILRVLPTAKRQSLNAAVGHYVADHGRNASPQLFRAIPTNRPLLPTAPQQPSHRKHRSMDEGEARRASSRREHSENSAPPVNHHGRSGLNVPPSAPANVTSFRVPLAMHYPKDSNPRRSMTSKRYSMPSKLGPSSVDGHAHASTTIVVPRYQIYKPAVTRHESLASTTTASTGGAQVIVRFPPAAQPAMASNSVSNKIYAAVNERKPSTYFASEPTRSSERTIPVVQIIVHEHLLGSRLRWDIAHPSSTARNLESRSGRNVLNLDAPATSPGVSKLTIRFANPSLARLMKLWGPVFVVGDKREVTVRNILDAIYAYFHTPLHFEEYNHFDQEDYTLLFASYTRRIKLAQHSQMVLASSDTLRIDILSGCTHFIGLQMGSGRRGELSLSLSLTYA